MIHSKSRVRTIATTICHNDELSLSLTKCTLYEIHKSLENGNKINFEKDLFDFCE